MDSPQFRFLNKKELSYIYEGNSNNVTLSSLLTLSRPFTYSQLTQSIKFGLNKIQQYYPMLRSCISIMNGKWCFCEKPSSRNEISFNWIRISSLNETIASTLENVCAQEMTNDFMVEQHLCRFILITRDTLMPTTPDNTNPQENSTTEVGFVFCFLHTAFDGRNIFTVTRDFIKEFEKTLLNSSENVVSTQGLKEGQINNLILPKFQTCYSNFIFFKEVIILFGWLLYTRPRNLPSSSQQIQPSLQPEKSKTNTYFHTLTSQETLCLIQFCKRHKFSVTSLLSTCISEIISERNGGNTVLGGLAVDLRQFLNISVKINGAFNSSILIRHPKVEFLFEEKFNRSIYINYLVNRIKTTNNTIQHSMKSGLIFHNLKFLVTGPIKKNENIKEEETIIPLAYVLSNLGICNQNVSENFKDDIITDWNNVFLSSTAKQSRGTNIEVTTLTLHSKMYISFCACSKFISNEDLRGFAINVLDLIKIICEHNGIQ
ncbi:11403_t:CDS:1 [Funneliformis geosporum]|uniref:7763_t:CDS:1 n=1 Tax=Funneliformis geosporum TaxID=1117311 RepID=A0A9W4SDR8_9GLOM|nr:11403_t:CDS:1 [Funneliformis geosporum]CAI2164777.1 7763_t:CDS:1 [Funneliformis geosporum]